MELREATIHDLHVLTKMNIQLRADEKMDNQMTDDEVEQRMKGFLEGESYIAYILKSTETVYGYALIDKTKKPIYLRQLFVEKPFRNKGLGREVIQKIMETLSVKEIDVDVMAWNEQALNFYEKFGFKRRYIGLRYKE